MTTADLDLPYDLSAVATARRVLDRELSSAGYRDEARLDAKLIVTELVANAIQHGTPRSDGTIGVRWRSAGSRVRLEVIDGGGEASPRRLPPDLQSNRIHGRGLVLVGELAADWGVSEADGGRVVYAELAR